MFLNNIGKNISAALTPSGLVIRLDQVGLGVFTKISK